MTTVLHYFTGATPVGLQGKHQPGKNTHTHTETQTNTQNTQNSHKIHGGKWTITSNYHKLYEQMCVSGSLLRHNQRQNKLFSLSN